MTTNTTETSTDTIITYPETGDYIIGLCSTDSRVVKAKEDIFYLIDNAFSPEYSGKYVVKILKKLTDKNNSPFFTVEPIFKAPSEDGFPNIDKVIAGIHPLGGMMFRIVAGIADGIIPFAPITAAQAKTVYKSMQKISCKNKKEAFAKLSANKSFASLVSWAKEGVIDCRLRNDVNALKAWNKALATAQCVDTIQFELIGPFPEINFRAGTVSKRFLVRYLNGETDYLEANVIFGKLASRCLNYTAQTAKSGKDFMVNATQVYQADLMDLLD